MAKSREAQAPRAQAPAGEPDSKLAGVVKTLREVGQAFGVSLNTVAADWRPNGMPGRRGAWDLAAIATWKRLRLRDPGTAMMGGVPPAFMGTVAPAAGTDAASSSDDRRQL
jgi:hypothetical protein